MDWQGFLVIALAFGSLVLLILEKASLDAIGLVILIVPVATGILGIDEALAGFSNHAVITIGALYVLGEGLTRTHALEFVARWVLDKSRGRESRVILLLGLIAALLSAFVNTTAIVVVFIPVLVGMAKTSGIATSRLMMPMAFASLMGGMCTLVGTSTNLLVSGIAEEQGHAGLGMFEMSPVGIPLAILGVLFLAVFSRRLLPRRQSLSTMLDSGHREYVTEILIGPHSDLRGKTYKEAFASMRAEVLFYARGEAMNWPPYFGEKVQEGDAVMLRGGVDDLADLQTRLGLKLVGDVTFDPRTMSFFELAVSPHSSMVGRVVGNLHLRRDYGAIAIAVLRAGQHIHGRVSEMVLRAGDLLLTIGDQAALAKLQVSSDFYLLSGAQDKVVFRGYARRALIVAGCVVGLFALRSIFQLQTLPLSLVALGGALAMVSCGCVTARRAYRSIDWPILIFIVGMLALGKAMKTTGVADTLAGGLIHTLAGYGPSVMVSALVLLCIVFNMLVSHSAVVALITPIALAAADTMSRMGGFEPSSPQGMAIARAFLLAVAFGGSICFATPIGHQVNLMVYGPGGYRYSDFVRLGLPLSLLAWAVISLGIPMLVGL